MDMHEMFRALRDIVKNIHENVHEAKKYAGMAVGYQHTCKMRTESYKEMAKGHISFNDGLKRVYDKYMKDVEEAGHKEYYEWMKMVFGEWMHDISEDEAEVHMMLNQIH